MDIVIVSEFCEDFSESDNDRFFYLAKQLLKDNDVEIVTSSFRHTTKSHRNKLELEYPLKITCIDEPGYPKNICLKRFYSHFIWGKNVAQYLKNRTKPDVVYCAVPSLTGPNLIAKFCEKNNIRFVIDIQDIWPEAFQMIVNIPIISKVCFLPFTILANGIYKRADVVCAVSDTYAQRALRVNKKCKKATAVFLGTELSTFDKYALENPILKKDESEIWLAYCGTLGSSYDITCVIDALVELDDSRIRFLVMGDGPKFEEFKNYAELKKIKATFTGRIPYDQMCSLLSICDITVNPIVQGSAGSIINKHADYAACGLPVLNTQESEEYRELVNKYNMGLNSKNNDAKDLAKKMGLLLKDASLREKMGKNARRCAEEKFDRKYTYQKLLYEIIGD